MSLKVVWDTISKEELSRKDCCGVDLASVTQEIVNAGQQYTLRAEGHLVYGISQIWDKKAFYLKQDSIETEKDIEISFADFLTSAHIQTRAAAPSLDFVEPEIPSSQARSDYSVDAVMRSDSNEVDELVDDVVRTETELQELEHMDELALDFGDDEPFPAPPGLDFGSDLQYSSSPPRTPPNEPEIIKSVRKRSAKQAVLDDEISLRIPHSRTVPQKFRRRLEFKVVREHDEETEIPLGDAAKLLDLEYIETHNEPTANEPIEPITNEPINEEAHLSELEMDFGLDEPSFNLAISDDEHDEHDDELKAVAKQTRARILRAVQESEVVEFDDLAQTAQQRACTLMEVLVLASKREITATQTRPFGSIEIRSINII